MVDYRIFRRPPDGTVHPSWGNGEMEQVQLNFAGLQTTWTPSEVLWFYSQMPEGYNLRVEPWPHMAGNGG